MTNIFLFSKRIAIGGFILLLLVMGFYLIGWHLYFFLLIFASILLAVMFCGIADWLQDKLHTNWGISLFLSVVLVFGLIIGIFWLIAPTIAEQFRQMSISIPQSMKQVQNWLSQYGWGGQILQKVPDNISLSTIVTGSGQSSMFSKVTGALSSTLSFLVDLTLVLVTALFLAATPGLYKNGFADLFPLRNRDRVLEVLGSIYTTLKHWLLAMLLSMTIVGISTAIVYKILGLPMAFALATLAFFFEFVPNIGPLLAGIPAILVGLMQGGQTALIVAVVYFGIQFLESFVILPIIMKKAVDLPPALLLFFQVLLGILAGALGLLLAAPLLAVLMVAVRELWIKDVIRAEPLNAGESYTGEGEGGQEEGAMRIIRKKVIRRE